jgi:hypothetical protein
MDGVTLELRSGEPTPRWLKIVLVVTGIASALLMMQLLYIGIRNSGDAVPVAMLLVLVAPIGPVLYGLQRSGAGPTTLLLDDRHAHMRTGPVERDVYWDRVVWAYVRCGWDTRDALGDPFGRGGFGQPFYPILQPQRPPYHLMFATQDVLPFAPGLFEPSSMATVIDYCVDRLKPEAIDPSLLLLLGLCGRITASSRSEGATPVVLAANRLDAGAVAVKKATGPADTAIQACFACLVGRMRDGSAMVHDALKTYPDSWDLRLCAALCDRRQRPDDAAGLLEPVLACPDLPPRLRPALEAAAMEASLWYDPPQ